MERIAKFDKVSEKEFVSALEKTGFFADYKDLILPKRATEGSAGYDFFAPDTFTLEKGKSIVIPTGIRAKIESGWVLCIYPRSGLGFKYRLMLSNTAGIIDSDYYFSDNEGHIMVKLYNGGDKAVIVKKGEAFCQGIFFPFGITYDDEARKKRNGGFGSTDK